MYPECLTLTRLTAAAPSIVGSIGGQCSMRAVTDARPSPGAEGHGRRFSSLGRAALRLVVAGVGVVRGRGGKAGPVDREHPRVQEPGIHAEAEDLAEEIAERLLVADPKGAIVA